MSNPLQRGDTGFFASLSGLCLELSRINLCRPKILGDQIVQVVSSHLGTDRVALLFASPSEAGFAKVFAAWKSGLEHYGPGDPAGASF